MFLEEISATTTIHFSALNHPSPMMKSNAVKHVLYSSLLGASVSSAFVPPSSQHLQRFASHRQLQNRVSIVVASTSAEPEIESTPAPVLVGDDSAYFDLKEQSLENWIKFSVATGTVLAAVAYAWVWPSGPHWGDAFLDAVQSTTGTKDPAITVASMLTIFAFFHSGLAGLRTYAEPITGPRAFRVVFAVVSLPLALSCISYFVNHAHEGQQLWDATGVPGIHTALWITNFISFLFLYPSTFNLLEIAAIEKPQLHLWETGIIRITRHPQAVGQCLWCLAHTIWLGTTTALAASAILVLHHGFAVWHGDRRLQTRHGEAFEYVKERTSVLPFAAILDGRQQLPDDFYKELLRVPYAVVVGGTIAAYFAHPYMQAGAALLNW
jgi:zeta-carotene isomerase